MRLSQYQCSFLGTCVAMAAGLVSFAKASPPPVTPETETEYSVCKQDFRMDSPGGLLEKLPIRRQVVGNCYAEAAATLLDAWGISHPAPVGYADKGHRALPIWLSDPGLANPLEALKFAAANGSCNESAFLKASTEKADDHERYEAAFNSTVERLFALQMKMSQSTEQSHRKAQEAACLISKEIVPENLSLLTSDLENALAYLKRNAYSYPELKKFYDRECRKNLDHVQLPSLENAALSWTTPPTAANVAGLVDTLYRANQPLQPVAVGICSFMLNQNRALSEIPGATKAERDAFSQHPACGAHAVVLLGRRWNVERGRCEFLIRDSGRPPCEGLKKSIECDVNNGQYWLGSSDLSQSVIELYSLNRYPN